MLAVLEFLPPPERSRAAATCRRWYRLCRDPAAWRRWCRRLGLPPLPDDEARQECVSQVLWREDRATVRVSQLTTDCGLSEDAALLDFSPERALVRTPAGGADVWSTEGHGLLCSLQPTPACGESGAAVLSARVFGDRAVTVCADLALRLWCLQSGQLISVMRGHSGQVGTMDLDTFLVTGGADHKVGVWEADSGECRQMLSDHGAARPLSVRCCGRRALSADWSGRALLWDLAGPRCVRDLTTGEPSSDQLDCPLLLAVTETHAAIGDQTGRIRLLCAATGANLFEHSTCEQRLFAVHLNERHLVVAGGSGMVGLWRLDPVHWLFRVSVFMVGSYRTALRHGLLFVQSDTVVQVYDVEQKRQLHLVSMPPLAQRQLRVLRNKALSVTYHRGNPKEVCFHVVQVKIWPW